MTNKIIYNQPSIPDKGYSFVAAGALHRNFGGYSVYVKYKAGKKGKIRIKQQTANHIWFICPDRELVIVKNNHTLDAFYPSGESFDTCLDFSIFNDQTSQALNIEYIMTNFAHNAAAVHPRSTSNKPPQDRIQILSDSGGLQLARGVTSTIHPKDLVTFYNNNVDAGMVLDLPLFFNDPKIIRMAARQQRDNTNVMMKYNQGVDLINIIHGKNMEERTMFREIVEDERLTRIAIGGLGKYCSTAAVDAIYELVTGKFKYKQHHILGVYTAGLVPLMIKIANGSLNVHLTSDSTSHIQSAINKAYHYQFDIYHNMKRLPIGSRNSERNTLKELPCQCRVCTTLKYTDILGFGSNRYTLELLSIHNAYEMSRYAASLQEACINSSPREFNILVEKQLGKSAELQQVQHALDFIDITEKYGLDAARKKHALHLNNRKQLFETTPRKPLFQELEKPIDALLLKGCPKENMIRILKQMKIAIQDEK